MRKILAFLSHSENESVSSQSAHHHSLQPGKQFFVGNHRLTIESVIAEGGFGVVCRVRSQEGRVFAMKRTCVNNNSDLATVKREVTIVSSLSHKNIIKYIDSTITETEPGIYEVLLVTSFYPGSVAQVLTERRQKNQRFLETEVLRVLCDVCEAVSRLHHCETPIIHRDLKIENILIDNQKNFVLCDFGSATSRVLHPGKHGPLRCQEEIEK
ncbi:BMP-2-inducible protein kinase [Sparganum proliferum]